MTYTVPMESELGLSPAQDPGANHDAPGMTHLIPRSFALLVWLQGIQFFLSFYPEAFAALVPEVWWDRLVVSSLTMIIMALLLPIHLSREGLNVTDLGFSDKPGFVEIIRAIAAGVCIWLLAYVMFRYLGILTGGAEVNAGAFKAMKEAESSLGLLGRAEFFGLFFPILIQAPLIEEIIYRGVIVTSLRACWGESAWKNFFAAAVSGLLFSIVHGLGHPLYYGVYFLIGLAFAYLYQRTRSLTSVIIAHGVYNSGFLIKMGAVWFLTTSGLRG